MFSIGEFSKIAKTTIRTLRFYDEIGLFKPSYVENNGYRYYSSEDLNKIAFILELREIGLTIDEIKKALNSENLKNILISRSETIEMEIQKAKLNLSFITNLISRIDKGAIMKKYQANEKLIPEIKVYYRHGIIENMSKLNNFVLEAGAECMQNNPSLKCGDYCYVTYEADHYQENDVEFEYCEQVLEMGKESQNIKFKIVPAIKAISVVHKGSYTKLGEAYAYAVNYAKEKNHEIIGKIREVYIHGCWDCESEDDYETEIQIPIK